MQEFQIENLKKLYGPGANSSKEDNGKVTIIGGSSLFHGAPILALKIASQIVDMVFFASPEPSVGKVAKKIKGKLSSFIWVPWGEREECIKKSDAVLIGPGLMRYHQTKNPRCQTQRVCDQTGEKTKQITHQLLQKFPQKQWVIDAGSLQVMDTKLIPKNAILTPNKKEFKMLFGRGPDKAPEQIVAELAKKYQCTIVLKKVETIVCSPKECVVIKGGNAGLTKGGTGDVLAGLAVALAAKNPPFLAACTASFIIKKASDKLYRKVGFAYNADDLAEETPEVLGEYFR